MSLVSPRAPAPVVARLAAFLAAPDAADAPRLRALVVGTAPRRVVAVDGSHSILAESGDALLAAYRAGSATPGRAPHVPAPELVLLTPEDARAQLAERLEGAGLPAQGVARIDPSGALDALRTLAEAQEALRAVGTLSAGDLLLVDGALHARAHAPLLDRVLAEASARGVDVVGVCKSTSLRIGHAPALAACRVAGRGFASPTWLAPLATPPTVRGASYAARLSPAEERVFRFDVASPRPVEDVLAGVAALCGHPAYPGYPSPLAMAHNAVLLNEDTRRQLLARVHEAALDAGVDERAWDAAFTDYHDILELGA